MKGTMRFPVLLLLAASAHGAVYVWYTKTAAPPTRHAVFGEVSVELMPAPSSVASPRVESRPTRKQEEPTEQVPTVPPAVAVEEVPVLTVPRFDNQPVAFRPPKIEKPRFEVPPEIERIRFVRAEMPKKPEESTAPPSKGSTASQGSDQRPRGVMTPPRQANTVPLTYPETARQNGWDGIVTVWIRISSKGEVTETRVEKSSGHAILDRAAQDHARRMRFDPATEDGKPVETTGSFDVRYRLR